MGFHGSGPYKTPTFIHEKIVKEIMDSGGNDHSPFMQFFQHQPLNLINSREPKHAANENYQIKPDIYRREETSQSFAKSFSHFHEPRQSPNSYEIEIKKATTTIDEEELILKNLFAASSGAQNQSVSIKFKVIFISAKFFSNPF